MSLRERIAHVLGWTVEDTKSFSLNQLRAWIRGKDPELEADLDDLQREGRHLLIKSVRNPRNGKPHFPDPLA